MNIVVDFDGTCVSHEFPKVGKDIGAAIVLKRLVEAGHNLILFTMRSNMKAVETDDPEITDQASNYLDEAVSWFINNGIELYGIQKNPTQHLWTESPKAYGQLIIDDAALGCPLTYEPELSKRSFVCWETVEILLEKSGILESSILEPA